MDTSHAIYSGGILAAVVAPRDSGWVGILLAPPDEPVNRVWTKLTPAEARLLADALYVVAGQQDVERS
jgi:hypothetical protein